jgi:DNA recombination protein RmuC
MADLASLPWLTAAFLLGLLLGIAAAALFTRGQARRLMAVMGETQRRREAETDALLDGVKLAFHDISRSTAGDSRDDMLRLAQAQLASERRVLGEALESERGELTARIGTMLAQLERTQELIRELERDRASTYQALTTQIELAGDSAKALGQTTRQLARSLSGARLRGQLGEHLAEDVLKATGLAPGLHYQRQPALDQERRPDFVLTLGSTPKLAMDVKFPLDNHRRAAAASDDDDRRRLEAQFIRDVRQHIAAVAGRGYADPSLDTADFALLFVPSDALLVTIIELAPDIVDQAARQAVVLVGPSTLYALLRSLRLLDGEARLARSGRELARAMAGFRQAWERYAMRAGRTERRLEETLDELRKLYGLRRATVDRAMAEIDTVIAGNALEAAAASENGPEDKHGGDPPRADAIEPNDQSAANKASLSDGSALKSE